jgi:hypothetical protein
MNILYKIGRKLYENRNSERLSKKVLELIFLQIISICDENLNLLSKTTPKILISETNFILSLLQSIDSKLISTSPGLGLKYIACVLAILTINRLLLIHF